MSQAAAQLQPERRRDGNAEARRQAAIVDYVRYVAPQVIIFHPANGGLRSLVEAARFRWIGVLAGVLDLVLVLPKGRVAFWECKVPKGRLSTDQRKFIGRLEALGHSWALVRDIDDARRELAALGIETREAVARAPVFFHVSKRGTCSSWPRADVNDVVNHSARVGRLSHEQRFADGGVTEITNGAALCGALSRSSASESKND